YALVGESGSGKSTIAKMTIGLLPPSAGSVRIADADIWAERNAARQRSIRRQIQMIFQDPFASLNPRWRVGAIVAEPIKAFGLKPDAREREERVGELLSLVGLDPRDAGKFPHEFSGGQRQRIAIARALASEPDFIVCDEPTSALDVSVQAQVLN
ncbi:ATP-binding cassette domain-containing protein, partial [Rhizobiaceae sp. 2RAB30]